MLRPDDLPDAVEAFAYRHAAPLRPGADFRPDVADLIDSLRRAAGIGPARRTTAGSAREAVQAVPGHRRPVTAVAFSPRGDILASGSGDGTVRIWDVADRRVHAVAPIGQAVAAVAFSFDGYHLAVAGWPSTTARSMATRAGRGSAGRDRPRRWRSPLGTGGDADGNVQVWELEAAAGRRALVFTPDGQQVVVAGDPDDTGAVLVDVWRL